MGGARRHPHSADGLLSELDKQRALELLFRLVQVDPEARRHTRRRVSLAEAVDVAGGGPRGRALVDHLAGQRRRGNGTAGRWVNLIYETLIHSKGR